MGFDRTTSVLVVEDERIVARDLQETLAGMGYDAYAIASSADEALARVSEHCPDLVLMDVRIRGRRDGIETASLLRERFGVPVVYLTAHTDEATVERARRTEPFGYLVKPVKAADLRSAIEVAIYRHRTEGRARERARLRTSRSRAMTEPPLSVDQRTLVDRFASLSTMAAGIADQMSNPLAVVCGNASYVLHELRHQQGLEGGDLRGLSEAIQAQSELEAAARDLERIIADLAAFSRPPQPASPGPGANVTAAVEQAVAATAHELAARARVALQIAPETRAAIDEGRLIQILTNLLSNAAHAIAPGALDDNTVAIVASERGGRVALEVRDTGAGMPPDVARRVFEPFFTTKAPGTASGLGLAICQGVVTQAGGRVEVESQVGVGTTFRITLPAATVAAAAPSAAEPAPTTTRRGRILLIDDDPMVLKAMTRMLAEHEVVAVTDPHEVIPLLDRGAQFDVIFSDVAMPAMTGIELYEQLLTTHPEAARRVVFLTGGAGNARVTDFLAVVRNPTLKQPISVEALRAFVQQRLAES